MPSALITYFSQGGSTARVAEAIASGLEEAGYGVDRCNIKDTPVPGISGYDLLGMGSPVYYFRLPFNVTGCLKSLPGLHGLAAFSFLVYGTHLFDAGNALRRALTDKGAREVGHFHCHGAGYYLGNLAEGFLFSPDHPTQSDLARAKGFGRESAGRVSGASFAPPLYEPKAPLIFRIERALVSRWLVEGVCSCLFKVDPAKCTACGQCMATCPTGNIDEDWNGRPDWGRNCLGCLWCEMKCPEEAIVSAFGRLTVRAIAKPLIRYNVRHWALEPGLDHIRVTQRRGQTVRHER
jgi:flavodoxin/Pyruvate/2-oxoacid:ferredoxin oxidoreductase delta subunit